MRAQSTASCVLWCSRVLSLLLLVDILNGPASSEFSRCTKKLKKPRRVAPSFQPTDRVAPATGRTYNSYSRCSEYLGFADRSDIALGTNDSGEWTWTRRVHSTGKDTTDTATGTSEGEQTKGRMRLTFFSTQLALLRGRSTSAAPPRREKTTAQRICVGASCLLYWLLCGALCDVSRPTAALYFLVGLASTNADTGLLVVCPPIHGERLVDRWLATAGTVRVLVAVGQIGLAGRAHRLNFLFMLCLVVLAFRLLHLSRGVPRAPDQTWRWVRLHATWHLISVLGGAHALRSEAALLLPEGNVGEGGDPAGMAAAAAAAGAALRAFRGATTSPAGLVALGCVGAYLIYAWNRRAIFAAIRASCSAMSPAMAELQTAETTCAKKCAQSERYWREM